MKLLKFIEKDQLQTHDKEKESDKTQAERKNMEIIEKELQVQIVNVRSEIEKSKDIVGGLQDLGEFLLGLSPQAWVADMQAKYKQ